MSNKKNRNNKKQKEIIYYTKEEKTQQTNLLLFQLEDLGLGSYQSEMNLLKFIINAYISENIEFEGEIPFPGSKRTAQCNFKNNNKIPISINLKFNNDL